jgi:transposase
MSASPDTLLRLIRQYDPSCSASPRVLGVDDWAYRRGQVYGTILCDLEQQSVIDLLPDREAETLSQWLKNHPEIEIVSRDRATVYIEGITSGAPQALQVADRWHLLKNLRETVQKQLEAFQQRFEWQLEPVETTAVSTIREATSAREKRLQHRAQHLARYEQVMNLLKAGHSQQQVAFMLGIGLRTVNRYWNAPEYPERKRRKLSSTLLDPFQDYILNRWEAGCDNAKQLWRELCQQGFEGSYDTVVQALTDLRKGFPLRREAETERAKAQKKYLSAHEIAWLFVLDAERLELWQAQDLESVLHNYPETQLLKQLAREFMEIFQKRAVAGFQLWMQKVDESSFAVLQSFVKGLRKDEAAIVAALTLKWSNGPVEGQVNRLKLIKRQMYGRANFDLLRQRVVMRL